MSVSREQVLAVIERIARDELEVPRALAPEERLSGDLELDSMGLTIMAVGLENHFRIKLDEGDDAALETVEDVITLVLRRIDERDRGGATSAAPTTTTEPAAAPEGDAC